jgi:hypothetical protein
LLVITDPSGGLRLGVKTTPPLSLKRLRTRFLGVDVLALCVGNDDDVRNLVF